MLKLDLVKVFSTLLIIVITYKIKRNSNRYTVCIGTLKLYVNIKYN